MTLGSPEGSEPAEEIVAIFPVGGDRVLVGRTEGQVELINLPQAIESAKAQPISAIELGSQEERVWREADDREFLGKLVSLEDGVATFSVRVGRRRESVQIDLLRLHAGDVRALARSQIRQEKRTWHLIGDAPIEGWLREFDPPYLTIEVEGTSENQRLRVALAALNAGEYPYLRWLEHEAYSRLLGRVERWQVEESILDRLKTAEQDLQGVWQITAGYDAELPPDDRYVMFRGDQMYLPSVVAGQSTSWSPQRFVCDPDAKPYSIIDRYEDGILQTSIYEQRGGALWIEFGFLHHRPQGFQEPWILHRVNDSKARELELLLR